MKKDTKTLLLQSILGLQYYVKYTYSPHFVAEKFKTR